MSCQWEPLKRAWLCLLCILPPAINTHWPDSPEPPLRWTHPALSAFSHSRECSNPLSHLCGSVLVFLQFTVLFYWGARTGPSTTGIISQCWLKGRNHLLQLAESASLTDAAQETICHLCSDGSSPAWYSTGLPSLFLTSCSSAEWPHQHRGEMVWFSSGYRWAQNPKHNLSVLDKLLPMCWCWWVPNREGSFETWVLVFSYPFLPASKSTAKNETS